MSVLGSTYHEEIEDRDRYGEHESDYRVTLHVGTSFFEHIHLSIDTHDAYNEVTLTVEEALKVHAGLTEAIIQAMKGREK